MLLEYIRRRLLPLSLDAESLRIHTMCVSTIHFGAFSATIVIRSLVIKMRFEIEQGEFLLNFKTDRMSHVHTKRTNVLKVFKVRILP